MTRSDAVSPELALFVFARDHGCVAPRLGGTAMDCWGRNRIEHVKAHARMGKRAEPCPCRLATVCEGHAEPGMRAGFVWATANRSGLRDYIATFGYSPHVDGHLDALVAGTDHSMHVDPCSSVCRVALTA